MLLLILGWSLITIAPQDNVRVTNTHLVVACVAGNATDGKQRSWHVDQPTSFVFTTRNEPRPGVGNGQPGRAMISFTPVAGHSYEIELRADTDASAKRVWSQREWTPVVRDRTADKVVSDEPRWVEKGCGS